MTSDEFDSYMLEKYPRLMREMELTPFESCMSFGCTIPKGWRWILNECCFKLKSVQNAFEVDVVFRQIKQKFGVPGFYYSVNPQGGLDPAVKPVVGDIIEQSKFMCGYYCSELGEPLPFNQNRIKRIGHCKYSEKGAGICQERQASKGWSVFTE